MINLVQFNFFRVSKKISKNSVNGLLKSAGLEKEDYFDNSFYCLANLSGTSLHNILHYTQCIDSNETRKLDLGGLSFFLFKKTALQDYNYV